MKREILFKGKGLNGIWYKGNLIESSNGECYILQKNSNPIRKGSNGYWDINSPCFQVHPDTVCQFTGLLDKNGNKIFDGSNVSDGVFIYVIEWNQNQAGFYMKPIEKIDTKDLDIIDAVIYQKLGDGYLKRRDLEIIHDETH